MLSVDLDVSGRMYLLHCSDYFEVYASKLDHNALIFRCTLKASWRSFSVFTFLSVKYGSKNLLCQILIFFYNNKIQYLCFPKWPQTLSLKSTRFLIRGNNNNYKVRTTANALRTSDTDRSASEFHFMYLYCWKKTHRRKLTNCTLMWC